MSKYGSRDNKLVSEKVTTDDLEAAAQTIGTTEIADAAITAIKLASDSVETAKILDANVTTGKLAADAVTNPKLADAAVQTENILDASVNLAKLEASIKKGLVCVGPLDVTGTTVWYLEFPHKVDIDKVIGVCSTAIDATCNIQAKNAAGTMMTDGSFNFDPTGAKGDSKSASPTANREIAADASMQIVSDGLPTGGAIYAVVHYTRKA